MLTFEKYFSKRHWLPVTEDRVPEIGLWSTQPKMNSRQDKQGFSSFFPQVLAKNEEKSGSTCLNPNFPRTLPKSKAGFQVPDP